MAERAFIKGDILIPVQEYTKDWSVVACDQFTSQPEYWRQVEQLVGGSPSTLHMMLPEAWLRTERGSRVDIGAAMNSYLESGVFETLENSFVYVERRLSGGMLRRGLVGLMDIEAYDYAPDSERPVRATEGTVAERLPPRVELRLQAPLEMPHVIVFMNDPENSVMQAAKAACGKKLYDIPLMQGGGHLTGYAVSGSAAEPVERYLDLLGEPSRLETLYGNTGRAPAIFAVGDGNHSLAAAKLCWEQIKKTLTPEECAVHPARYSLVELVNIHDEAVGFEPIHRVIFDSDCRGFINEARALFASAGDSGEEHSVVLLSEGEVSTVKVRGPAIGEIISLAENLCKARTSQKGGRLDYIHGDDTARGMCAHAGVCGILLPAMDKSELFTSINRSGVFPRKSFSIGLAEDKRYYMECRRIK